MEDKLVDVIGELQARAQIDQERHIAKLEEQARRQQEWEAAMASARFRFAEDIRIKEVSEQVTAWEDATKIRTYCEALETALRNENDERSADATVWIRWARGYADRIDPLRRQVFQPVLPEPKPYDLKPYLGRWSPYGPEAGY